MPGLFENFFATLNLLGQNLAVNTSPINPGGATDPLAAIRALQNGGAAVTPFSASPNIAAAEAPPLVWLGQRVDRRPNPRIADTDGYRAAMKTINGAGNRVAKDPSVALNLPYTWSEKEREAAYKRVSEAVGQPIRAFDQFNQIWASAVKTAQQSWTATNGGKSGSPLSVWDVFDLAKREGAKYGYGAGGAGGGGSQTTVSHSSSVEKLSDGTTWQILKQAATAGLGRAPTHNELQRFASKANQVASSHPTKTTTRTTSSAGGSNSHSTTKQGASAGDYQLAAENQINANPEAGAYAAATTYANALFQGLESPV